MALQNVDHPTVHRPMSLLLQALKQIELKTPTKLADDPPGDCQTADCQTADCQPVGYQTVDCQTVDCQADVSSSSIEEVRAADTRKVANCETIELIRRYDASETATEIALAGPVHIAAVPVVATPARSGSKSITHDGWRRRRFAGDVLKLLPHDGRAVIGLAPVEGIEVWPVVRELCRGLVGKEAGDVLAVAQTLAAGESVVAGRFSDLLSARERWQSAIREDANTGFFILERGDDETIAASNGRSLLKLWEELNKRFAYVVVDAGLADPAAVTSLLSSCDGTFAVIRLDSTDRRQVERLIARIRSVGGRACGCLVVN